ncbi:GlxA family transcriptional regulator [Tahibacter caeni]|uniref:GlxA family transcriptional regulator n=1 Tax=Tahibacter caeni TaxID=1453545 RepID=UPI002148591B|nr:helix-turn-helix domain-containing protein [Tahibacter caeni]
MRDFEVLVIDGAYPSSVAMSRDILDAAAQVAARIGIAVPTWGLYSLAGGRVPLRDGISVDTRALPPRRQSTRSVCVIPGLGADPDVIVARMALPEGRAIARRLQAQVQRGGQLAASCSAVFVLQAAGLLAGRRATTTWWLAPALARLAPTCTVDAARMVCADGPVTTAGAAFAHADLMLHLLRERCGPVLSETVARMLLLEHRQSQSPFVVPEVLASGHALVAQLTARLEKSLPGIPPISQLARELCVSEKTLGRHVRRATGKSTSGLVRSVKLRRARALLENSRMTIEQIAAEVGYRDATALRRLMRKAVGASPRQFRATTTVDG